VDRAIDCAPMELQALPYLSRARGASAIFCGHEVRLNALPATIREEDGFKSADFSLAR
jgi:hypothetical protein